MSGNVPNGWREVRIGQIAREVSCRNQSGADIPVLSMTKHRGFVRSNEYFSRSVYSDNTDNYKIVRRGQFAYATIHLDEGSIDYLKNHDAGLISPMYTVFELSSADIDKDVAFRNFKRFALGGRFDPYSNGGVNRRKSILFSDLAAFKFVIPPLAEQRAIAEVLGTMEETIAATDALITALTVAKHATMRELLTRGIRRVQAPMKLLPAHWVLGRVAQGITHIPVDWELVTLTKVAKLESGHTPSRDKGEYWNGAIPWLSLADTEALDALEVAQTSECVTDKGIQNSSARVLPKDTVVFSRTATVGKASRLKRPMATSQDFANWVCGPTILPAYLVQVFRHMKREWDRLQEGSTHQTIYMPVFKKLQMLLPPIAEQQKIADIGEAFDTRIAKERETRKALTGNRDALAQELLSGRVRCPESIVARYRDKAAQAA